MDHTTKFPAVHPTRTEGSMFPAEADKRFKLLIVDDDNSSLKILTNILSPEYILITAANGNSAVEKIKEYKPDLILLNIQIPVIDGYDVFSELKNNNDINKIPLMIISDNENIKYDDKFITLDAVDVISKPFDASIVKMRVRNQIKLISAAALIKSANNDIFNFLSNLNLEIRTPLNAILGISAIQLQNETHSQDVVDAFSGIYNSGDILLQIINDIMDMSTFDAGKSQLVNPLNREAAYLKKRASNFSYSNLLNIKRHKKTHIVRENIKPGRVLIVDDVDINLYIAKEMLSPYGLDIDLAVSGEDALGLIRKNNYDLVFMDHIMPVMDGIETTKEIRKMGYNNLPVIALTANAITGVKKLFLDNGFNGFISKPIGLHDLDGILKQWMLPK